MKTRLIYSDKYDFKLWGLNKLHPFDGMKFSKAWKLISTEFKDEIDSLWIKPQEPISDELLLKVHTREYLASLNKSSVIAAVIELWPAKYLPLVSLYKMLINPIKLACSGTLLAAETALNEQAIAMNIGGGYHHAFADHGEGFCFFADAALSIIHSRDQGLLSADDTVLMIDLDAHRGNGFESIIKDDAAVKNFDIYCFQSYPGMHEGDMEEFPYMIPLKARMRDELYLNTLKTDLVKFLDENKQAKLVFYNAGNDILDSDPLGGFSVSYDGVVKRDRYVIDQLTQRGIPTVVMTSGGYTNQSHKLIAELAKIVIEADKV